jgi:hypothetical protein
MPVIDHAIHPMTQFGDEYRYGCHSSRNAGRKSAGYWVKVRKYHLGGEYEMVDQYIPNRASKLCRFDMRQQDLNCRDCANPSDVEYLKGYGL